MPATCLTKPYGSIFSQEDNSFQSVLEFCLFDPTDPDAGILVDDIVVVGHTGCGAIKASQEIACGNNNIVPDPNSGLHAWLAPIVELAKLHPCLEQNKLAVENIKRQVELIAASPLIDRHVHRPGGHPVIIHGWLYDITTAKLSDVSKCTVNRRD